MATTSIGLSEVTTAQKRTLIAAALGWALDAFDVMLYSLVIAHVMNAFGISKAGAGWLSTFTLFASGIGGVLFGFIADRVGRTKALTSASLPIQCVHSARASPLPFQCWHSSVSCSALAWAANGTPEQHWWRKHGQHIFVPKPSPSCRVHGRGLRSSGGSCRFGLKATQNWRYVFFLGILPALVTLWIRKSVPESEPLAGI